jgi:hypothetical protein
LNKIGTGLIIVIPQVKHGVQSSPLRVASIIAKMPARIPLGKSGQAAAIRARSEGPPETVLD